MSKENRAPTDIVEEEGFSLAIIGVRLKDVDELHNLPVVEELEELKRFKPKKFKRQPLATNEGHDKSYFVKVTGV